MKLKTLTNAILLSTLCTQGVYAAGMDRSGQSISAFLQPNNYFEAGISVLDADVSGKMRNGWNMPSNDRLNAGADLANTNISDMAESFHFVNFALKYQANEHISLGLIYDQPFGAKASYSANDPKHTVVPTLPLYDGDKVVKAGAFHHMDEGTNVEVSTQSLSLIMGYQPNEHWNIYAGPVYQTVKGDVSLRGTVYGPFGGVMCSDKVITTLCSDFKDKETGMHMKGYDASIPEESEFGFLAGVAFQIPEIALKASLTYRSEIDYKVNVEERMPQANSILIASAVKELGKDYTFTSGSTNITTPQSINLDFQSGIMANTIAFANIRWVDWSKFAIRPHKFGQLAAGLTQAVAGTTRGFDLIAYEKDQFSVNFGVARKLNEQWALSVLGGWDSGVGELTSTLGPTDGYWSAGLGAQFSPTPATFIQAGARYFWLGDAKAQSASWFGTERYDAEFKDNNAIGYSVKMGYRF
ncbi:OmpP1/FadL family transporter [Acinetobacter sp. ANC 3813]|uniref:OmpP1/FadL family transporter n=1 Tax=Acinetobacter sp. ANC 3813 TaxID=1977873 RepID=UPI000A3486E1|nr:outer membrane protein transport protein [Acinetobacter sp. ANC 3813]OTG89448.1 transporter [Acinetobacter sp. ANC 3813]